MFLGHTDDAMGGAPDAHKVIFENDTVRMLEAVIPPGSTVPHHWHPSSVLYVLAPGKMRFNNSDGSGGEAGLKIGQVIPNGELEHTVENIGDTEVRLVAIEFKN